MNPYKTKTGIGQKVINGLLIAGVALTLAATITVGVSQKDNIKAALNGMARRSPTSLITLIPIRRFFPPGRRPSAPP